MEMEITTRYYTDSNEFCIYFIEPFRGLIEYSDNATPYILISYTKDNLIVSIEFDKLFETKPPNVVVSEENESILLEFNDIHHIKTTNTVWYPTEIEGISICYTNNNFIQGIKIPKEKILFKLSDIKRQEMIRDCEVFQRKVCEESW
jgi:hypothetical protein